MRHPASPETWSSCLRTTFAAFALGTVALDAAAACRLVAMAGGAGHTLALVDDGTLLSWGLNAYGQLGNGSRSFAIEEPIPVAGLSNIVAIAAGDNFSLALHANGRVFAWGENSYGALGNGSTDDIATPLEVVGLDSVTAIAAGSHHALALRNDGALWAWGGTWNGQFGNPSEVLRTLAAPTVLTGITAIAAGGNSSLALDDSRSVFAMGPLAGENSLGPTVIGGLDQVVAIAAGGDANGLDHALALLSNGAVRAWGDNSFGQIGDGSTIRRDSAVQVPGLINGARAIAAGAHHSLAINASSMPLAWGRNHFGQLGSGDFDDAPLPVPVAQVSDVTRIAAGAAHTMAILSNGFPQTWGSSATGQLGRLSGSFSPAGRPIQVGPFVTVTAVSTRGDSPVWVGTDALRGEDHTLALAEDGQVWAFGANRFGQLGNGGNDDASAPVLVAGVSSAVAVAAGARHSLALGSDGLVRAWGNNDYGQLGDGSVNDQDSAVVVPGLAAVVAIAAGERDSLAVTDDGTVWAWGWFFGDLSPTPVAGFDGACVAVAAGAKTFYALRDDGTVRAWGWNDSGQLGDGSATAFSDVPVAVTGLDRVVALSAGASHVLAVRQDATAWTWGGNSNGQLGDGTRLMARSPARIATLANVIAVAAGAEHSLAATYDGRVWAWGRNFSTETAEGDSGDAARKLLPVQLAGPRATARLAAGATTSAAFDREGNLQTWGWNGLGQLGDGATTRTASAGPVALDAAPPAQGNVLRLAKNAGDVVLDFAAGTASNWSIFRDADKNSLGRILLDTRVVARRVVDDGAVNRPSNDFYSVAGLSACTGIPEQ